MCFSDRDRGRDCEKCVLVIETEKVKIILAFGLESHSSPIFKDTH